MAEFRSSGLGSSSTLGDRDDNARQAGEGGLQPEAGTTAPSRHQSLASVETTNSLGVTPSGKKKRDTQLRRNSEDLANQAPLVANLVSFRGQRNLLRASSLRTIMRSFCEVFASSIGSADTYALSEEVENIGVFLSHNWVVGRSKKFLCLAVTFNFRPACFIAAVAMLAIFIASDVDLLPRVAATGHGVCNTLLVAPIFFLVAFFGHHLPGPLGLVCGSPTVFLDKTCIHQSDMAMQQEGIQKLGAFVRHSSRMVVIYSDVYLLKLWTVYEVACFTSIHPSANMTVIPTYLPVLSLGGLCVMYGIMLVRLLFESLRLSEQAAYVFFLIGSFPYVMVLRRWSRTKVDIQRRMAEFCVEECICTNESDREIVYGNISLLMRATSDIPFDATEENIRDAFNERVRTCLPHALTSSVGSFGLGYLHAIAMFFYTDFPTYLDKMLPGQPWATPGPAAYVLVQMIWQLAIFPFCIAFLACWSGFCLHLRGWREWSFLSLGIVLTFAMSLMVDTVLWVLLTLAENEGPHRMLGLQCIAIIFATLTPLAILTFNRQRVMARCGGGAWQDPERYSSQESAGEAEGNERSGASASDEAGQMEYEQDDFGDLEIHHVDFSELEEPEPDDLGALEIRIANLQVLSRA